MWFIPPENRIWGGQQGIITVQNLFAFVLFLWHPEVRSLSLAAGGFKSPITSGLQEDVELLQEGNLVPQNYSFLVLLCLLT
jgi:hypothetical protein